MPNIDEVQYFLDNHINPALANHKGKCEIVSLDNKVLTIRLLGQCSGCPGRKRTLINTIKPFLLDNIALDNVLLAE